MALDGVMVPLLAFITEICVFGTSDSFRSKRRVTAWIV